MDPTAQPAPSLADLLDAARRRNLDVDAALAAFRLLSFDDQLRFLVTIELDIVARVGGGTTTIPLSAAAASARAALPAAVPEPPPTMTAEPLPMAAEPPRRGPRGRYGPEMTARVCELFDQGMSQGEICKQVGVSYPTVNKLLRGAGRPTHLRGRGSARSSSGQLRAARADDSEGSPRSEPPREPREPRERKPASDGWSNPPPLPRESPDGRRIGAAGEIKLAHRLEELETAAWQLVLDEPALSGDSAIAEVIRELGNAARDRTGTEIAVIDAAALRWADGDRYRLDQIIRIAREAKLEPVALGLLEAGATEARAIRNRFVQGNLGLVGMITKTRLWTGLPYEDLMQEGTIGLMHAIGKYDYRRGMRFSTYATHWIRHSVRRFYENSAEVRLPVHLHTARSKIYTTTIALKKELRREPTRDEIAARAGIPVDHLDRATGPGWWITGTSTSLDHEVSEGITFGDAFADPETETTALHHMVDHEARTRVMRALERLPAIEADILRRRFGIDCEPQILAEVGEDYELSRERIRQLETRALERLRSRLEPS